MFPICSLVAWNKPSVILALFCCLKPPCLILHEYQALQAHLP